MIENDEEIFLMRLSYITQEWVLILVRVSPR